MRVVEAQYDDGVFRPAARLGLRAGERVNLFLASNPTPATNALYVFWGGANDVFGGDSATTAASNVQANINTLATLGAKYFLWVNLPPVGETPAYIVRPIVLHSIRQP